MFTFLPQCTVHNMPISELGVPDSKKQWRSKFTEKKHFESEKIGIFHNFIQITVPL